MKKILVYLCIVAVILTCAGCGSSSDDAVKIDLNKMTITGKGAVIDGKNINITSGGEYNVSGTLVGGMIYVNTSNVVRLNLDSVDIYNDLGPAIYVESGEKVHINLNSDEESYLVAGTGKGESYSAVYSKAELVIEGIGVAKFVGETKNAVECTEDVTVDGGNFILEADRCGIITSGKLSVVSGDMTIYAKSDTGLMSLAGTEITGGVVRLTTGDSGIASDGSILFGGGTVNIESSGVGVSSDDEITVDGGAIFVLSDNSGVSATNRFAVNSGSVVIETSSDNSPVECNGDVYIGDGTVFAVSKGEMSTLKYTADSRPIQTVDTGKQTVGAYVELKDSADNVKFDYTSNIDFNNLVISHNGLDVNDGSKVYINGVQIR